MTTNTEALASTGSPMSAPSFCWVCNKTLGGHHQRNKPKSFAVVADPSGKEHRVHKACVKDALQDGNKLVREHATTEDHP